MTEDSQAKASEIAPLALPRHTTPTWEVELLISGVAVFAMLQLAGWLGDQLFVLLPRIDQAFAGPLKFVFIYAVSASVILATTFVLHLLLRAHWIALVGIYSVYPDGVRWDRLRIGPVQKAMAEDRLARPDSLIERADNRATIVFAVGVQLASTLVLFSLAISVLFLLAIAACRMLGLQVDPGLVFQYCAYALLLPFLATMLADRVVGARLPAHGLARKTLAKVFDAYSFIGLSRNTPVISLVTSHGGRRRVSIGIALLMLVVTAAVAISLGLRRDPQAIGAYALYPDAGAMGESIDDAHYDDRRDVVVDHATPYIQSVVVLGPYLRLTVPYRPGHDDRAQRATCPAAIAATSGRDLALLACLQRLHPVRLDGQAIANLHYDAGSDPRTDRPALLAMIDVRGLSPGRHELAVAQTTTSGEGADTGWERIVFWR